MQLLAAASLIALFAMIVKPAPNAPQQTPMATLLPVKILRSTFGWITWRSACQRYAPSA